VFYGLVPASQHTPSLFDAPLVKDRSSKAQLMRSMDSLNTKFGKNTLHYAVSHGAQDRAPMRIAFTRIPDLETER
jgi:DNA polymerase IV